MNNRKSHLTIHYDHEGDILEMLFEDAPASLEEIAEDIFERRTPDGRVIGFMVLNFSRHDRETLALPLHITATAPA